MLGCSERLVLAVVSASRTQFIQLSASLFLPLAKLPQAQAAQWPMTNDLPISVTLRLARACQAVSQPASQFPAAHPPCVSV